MEKPNPSIDAWKDRAKLVCIAYYEHEVLRFSSCDKTFSAKTNIRSSSSCLLMMGNGPELSEGR